MIEPIIKKKPYYANQGIRFFRIAALALTGVITLFALIYPFSIRPYSFIIEVGDVAPQDILAPRNLSYQSDLLLQKGRRDAEDAISAVYLPADPSITRNQIDHLNAILDYIENIRLDDFGTIEQKTADIQAIEGVELDDETVMNLLESNDVTWQVIRQESLRVLELIMRNTIREDRLRDAQRNVPAYISFSLTEDQTEVLIDFVTPFIIPNSLYSEELTLEAKQQAVDAVSPVISTYLEGETIVNRGQVITPLIYEALQAFELVQPSNNPQMIVASFILLVLSFGYVILYFRYKKFTELENLSSILLICILFIITLIGIRLFDPGTEFLLYLYPLSVFALSVAFLYNREISFGLIPVISVFAAYGMPNSLTLTLFFLFQGYIGVMVLGRGRRIASFFWAGLAVSASGMAMLVAIRMINPIVDWSTVTPLLGAAFMNGIAAAGFTLLFQFVFAQLLGITTPLRLLDISRPDHPLLQLMLREAPGSYQHSLQVANLAEQAADAIGADSLLVRVGALYHDAGKALNPTYFIENQVPGMGNPHDDLEPEISSQIITKHIRDGTLLAKKFSLPPRIQDFMREHHGSMLTNYQYSLAIQSAGNDASQVNKEKFRYPGPAPGSRETALLMLADNVEARARAMLPKNEQELSELVQKTIDYLQQQEQLVNTDLTLRDLHKIRESFVKTLKNTHHLRIQYPEITEMIETIESEDVVVEESAG
jgi:cyclic-di-AMP phosphodiesterase PgpH